MANKKTTKTKSTKANSQKELIMVMVLSLALGVGGGYALGASANNTDSKKSTDSSKMEHAHAGHKHDHKMFEVSEQEAPKVELVVSEDPMSGYNVKIIATDFTFTPEDVNGDNVVGEGHAHLYVGDEKVARLYSPHYHYKGNFEGTKNFRVTLNANDHGEYAVGGEVIEAEVKVTHDSNAKDHDKKHMMHSEDMKSEEKMDSGDHGHMQ